MKKKVVSDNTDLILEALRSKACTKQKIYRLTLEVFNEFKEELKTYVHELHDYFAELDTSVEFEYHDNGSFECHIKFGGDVLVFIMHTNIFNFDENHSVHQTNYTKEDNLNAYCGMIEIYNFLSDSFKYQRLNDTGFLIARVFINKEKHFFVEGERQLGFLYNDLENMEMNHIYIKAIIEASILYAIEFDLWVPSYQDVQEITIGQKIEKAGLQGMKTSKRMGFKFQAEMDDIV